MYVCLFVCVLVWCVYLHVCPCVCIGMVVCMCVCVGLCVCVRACACVHMTQSPPKSDDLTLPKLPRSCSTYLRQLSSSSSSSSCCWCWCFLLQKIQQISQQQAMKPPSLFIRISQNFARFRTTSLRHDCQWLCGDHLVSRGKNSGFSSAFSSGQEVM